MCILTAGYGFVDFDSPAAALKAVHALKTSGIQAQMAKVSLVCVHIFFLPVNISVGLCFFNVCMCALCVCVCRRMTLDWSRDPS